MEFKITYIAGTNSTSQRYNTIVNAPSSTAARKIFQASNPGCKILAVN